MNEIRNKILDLLEDSSFGPYTFEELKSLVNCSDEELKNELDSLKDEFIIHETKKHRFGILKTFGLYKGVIEVKEKGFGFIKSDDFKIDLFVPRNNINGAMNNDTVIFRLESNDLEDSDVAIVSKVIKRSLEYVVGTIKLEYFHKHFIPIDNNLKMFFDITDYNLAVVDDVVKVKVDEFVDESHIKCHVVDILGNTNDVGMDIKAIASKFDFENEFNSEVKDTLEQVSNDYEEFGFNEEVNRREFIDKTIITIDGDDAKDLDDAVSCEKLDNGNYLLGVYIADVSYFVREDSAIDKEAYNRGTSVYLVDRVIPMLPHKLCNDLCSLNEGTKKLVKCCLMEINNEGIVENYEIKEAVIKTKHRMSYNVVNKILNGDKESQEKYYDIVNDIFVMNKLAKILNNMRVKRGSLNFEIPESEIIVNENGEPIDVKLRVRYDAEKLIEEFMLIANETVASCINGLDLPFIYRVHDVPNQEKLTRFKKILNNTHFNFNVKKNQKITPKVLQELLDQVNEEDQAISTMLLRLMAKAKYDVYNIGHYGLASTCYTHFTSPIRRYPDLIVHRLIRKYLIEGDVDVDSQTKTFNKLVNISEQASKRERDAIECEYEVNDMKMAEYMQMHIGETFVGTISSVTNFGLFVSLDNGIEGLVRIGSIKDDYYEYIDNYMSLVGRHTGKVYRLGDKIKVEVLKASKQTREIDFIIPLKNNKNMLKYSSERKSRSGGSHERRRNSSHRKK